MFTQQRAIENFTSEAITYAAGPIGLVASAAVCYLVGARLDQPITDLTDQMRKAVEDAGLKAATVYRYVRLGRDLAAEASKTPETEEAILVARSPTIAQDAVLKWLADQDIKSVDAISRLLGVYQRKPRTAEAEEGEAAEEAQPAAMKSEVAEERDEEQADPVAFAKELAHKLRLDHDMATLVAIRNVFDAEILALERSEKRRGKETEHRVHG